MIELQSIRKYPKIIDQSLILRGAKPLSHKILNIDNKYKKIIHNLQKLQYNRNKIVKQFSAFKLKSKEKR